MKMKINLINDIDIDHRSLAVTKVLIIFLCISLGFIHIYYPLVFTPFMFYQQFKLSINLSYFSFFWYFGFILWGEVVYFYLEEIRIIFALILFIIFFGLQFISLYSLLFLMEELYLGCLFFNQFL